MRTTSTRAGEPSADPLAQLGLSPAQTSLYAAVLRLHRAGLDEIALAADTPLDEVAGELAGLVRLGAVDEQAGEYLARHPAATIGRLIAARLDRLAQESRQIDDVLAAIGGLTDQYDAGRDHQTCTSPSSSSAARTNSTKASSDWRSSRRRPISSRQSRTKEQ
ncbi:hypothetical protein Acor_25070 [Acrocarpospora corrugata]|uniref:Transcription regulator TrmB N-terminal domain-containing protein n=1 Tax=Acrocarpospora corrugata TaxID=35763 RepID=A0A5M3VZD1_9ACTN|nr:hypothetical protein [Acrocarpospora corrugata]GES00443.1 hypothetical protein Acor_25070 [Acrocarpospora corrugata]